MKQNDSNLLRLLDGAPIEATSPGGRLWSKIRAGEQILVLETAKGQDMLDLLDVAQRCGCQNRVGGWLGSLSLATSMGLPDDYTLDIGDVRDAIYNLQERLLHSRQELPLLVDVDACYGNPARAFAMLNVLQVAVGVTENKRAEVVKVNSLVSGKDDRAQMASIQEMTYRLRHAKSVQKNTLVAARIENLIYQCSPEETLDYIYELQPFCDLLLLHWNGADPAPLLQTAKLYQSRGKEQRPLIAVTTAYGKTLTPEQLHELGFSILIYPNQLVRKNLFAGQAVYEALLKHPSAGGALDDVLPPTKEVIHRFSEKDSFTYKRSL